MLTLFVRVTSMYAGEGMDNHHFTGQWIFLVGNLSFKRIA
mgnify:CR=1 FL=1